MGEFKHDGLAVPGQVVLAHEPPFHLGKLKVVPATRQLFCGDEHQTLEPRVMQVLVVLARANGAIVTRDELIETCWAGRIVTDNAINRVISRIRQLAERHSGSFEVGTITKVGYRLAVAGQAEPETIAGPSKGERTAVSRRALIAGGASLAAATPFALLWRPSANRPERTQAEKMLRKGEALASEDLPGDQTQALAYFREATRVDPTYADAWGYLALAEDDQARARSAARRALEINPGNGRARLALLNLDPLYGNWLAHEAGYRAIASQNPDFRLAEFLLASVLCEVGRWRDAAAIMSSLVARDPLLPFVHYRLALALWSAGRLQDADDLLARASQRWPRSGAVLSAKVRILAFSGRAKEALALIGDPASTPIEDNAEPNQAMLATFRALASGSRSDVDSAVAENLRHLEAQPIDVHSVAANCAALGHVDQAIALCDGFFFGRGPWARLLPPPAKRGEMTTMFLFYPWTDAMRRDRRFGPMMRETGLEDYWSAARTQPDYRRPA